MATVVVLSEEAVNALVDGMFVGATINGSGNLILTTQGGDPVDVGNIKDHGGLTGLGDDDHTQYAKADGTRGSFASTSQGTKADAARPNKGGEIDIQAGDTTSPPGFYELVVITNDGTSSTGWVNRMEIQFKDNSGATPRTVFAHNEYGEVRGASAKHNTTWLRGFVEYNPANVTGTRDATIPIFQLMDNRTDRNHLWGLYSTGMQKIMTGQIPVQYVIVLGPSDAVPTGTPANTVIVRTT